VFVRGANVLFLSFPFVDRGSAVFSSLYFFLFFRETSHASPHREGLILLPIPLFSPSLRPSSFLSFLPFSTIFPRLLLRKVPPHNEPDPTPPFSLLLTGLIHEEITVAADPSFSFSRDSYLSLSPVPLTGVMKWLFFLGSSLPSLPDFVKESFLLSPSLLGIRPQRTYVWPCMLW